VKNLIKKTNCCDPTPLHSPGTALHQIKDLAMKLSLKKFDAGVLSFLDSFARARAASELAYLGYYEAANRMIVGSPSSTSYHKCAGNKSVGQYRK
jgi:hypothetical protein